MFRAGVVYAKSQAVMSLVLQHPLEACALKIKEHNPGQNQDVARRGSDMGPDSTVVLLASWFWGNTIWFQMSY